MPENDGITHPRDVGSNRSSLFNDISHVARLGFTLIAGIKGQVFRTQHPADSIDFDLRFVTTRENADVGLEAANLEGWPWTSYFLNLGPG